MSEYERATVRATVVANLVVEIVGTFDFSSEQAFHLGKMSEKHCLDEDGYVTHEVWLKLIEAGLLTPDNVLDLLTTTNWGSWAFYPFLETAVRFLRKTLPPEEFPMEQLIAFSNTENVSGAGYDFWDVFFGYPDNWENGDEEFRQWESLFQHPRYTADVLKGYMLLAKHNLFIRVLLSTTNRLSAQEQLEIAKELCNLWVWEVVLSHFSKHSFSHEQAMLAFEGIRDAYQQEGYLPHDLDGVFYRMIRFGFGMIPFDDLCWLGEHLVGEEGGEDTDNDPWAYIQKISLTPPRGPMAYIYSGEQMALVRERIRA